ncbi:MAG: hypothetical protein Q7R60_03530 [bacterium]|nr:hypothetical protein [bacterium]
MFKFHKIPANNPNVAIAPQKNWPKTGLAILLAVLVLAGSGFYLYHQNQLKTKRAAQPYAYTYKTLDSYTLAGEQAGSGMTFSKPVEFAAPTKSAAKTHQVQFSHGPTKDGLLATIAGVAAASVYESTALSASYMKIFEATIVDPKNAGYAALIGPLKDFVNHRLPSIYNTTFSTPKKLSTANLTSNAWEIDFTATVKEADQKSSFPNLQGQEVLVIGQKTFYYFMVNSVDYNWQSNQKIWQQVINSLKIDQ